MSRFASRAGLTVDCLLLRVYVLHVSQLVDVYEDSGRRDRRWFPIEEATSLLFTYKPVHVKYLAAMRNTRPKG